MAKNYTFSEAVEIIAKGTDLEAIADIGKRFPVLAVKVATVAAKAGESFTDLMSFMPEHLTANKVNTVIKSGITESDAGEDEGEDVSKDEATPRTTEAADSDYESMSGKELVKLLRKAGKGSLITSKKKADLVALCIKELGGSTDAEDEAEDDATEENAYEGMTAQELFKECKKRGLKAEAKKSAKFYTDLLLKDDAKNDVEEEADADADADDWDDEEEVEEAPKKESKKSSKKAEKKADKKPAKKVEEDEDDDWDI